MTARRLGLLLVALLPTLGCRQQMAEQPRYDPMEEATFWPDGRSVRPLEPGTVPRGALRTDSHLYEGSGRWFRRSNDVFPFAVDLVVLERGRERFNIYCSVCHDRVGHGNGKIVQRGYVQPPSYHLEPTRSKPVGHYYQVITNGYGAMPALNDQIDPRDRWAIVAYIRALQVSQDSAFAPEEKGGGRE